VRRFLERSVAVCVFASVAVIGCGDSDGGGDGGSGGGGTTTTGGATKATSTGGPPADSCIQPGDMGNELGVGEYCSPLGKQCMDNAAAQLCLADVGQDQWMCTRIGCDATTDCGEGAGCLIVQGEGSACVPCMCDSAGIGCSGTTTSSSASSTAASTTGGG
jgi:hypothetical protein